MLNTVHVKEKYIRPSNAGRSMQIQNRLENKLMLINIYWLIKWYIKVNIVADTQTQLFYKDF
jgi:hypothetical protein